MVGDGKALGLGHTVLALFNLGVKKLLHFAAVQAHQMVVVLAFIEFKNRLAALKMAAAQDAGLLELGQHAVHRGQADIGALQQQHAEHVLGRHVPLRAFLEYFQNLQARQRGLQAGAFEFVDAIHACFPGVARVPAPALMAGALPLQWPDHIATFERPPMLHKLPSFHLRPVVLGLGLAACAALAACSSIDGASSRIVTMVSPYKIDIVQGNFVSKEQAAALQNGMSRIQVRDILGTPLLTSLFHADRWDYVFTFKRQGREPQARKVTVFFKGDAMERVEADELPTEAEFVASLDSGRRAVQVPVLEASEESLAKFSAAKAAASAADSGVDAKAPGAPQAKVRPPLPDKYPPLEPSTR